jgi:hypothetical protein
MPEQGGFFAHPDLSTGRKSVFAVFHQLHCLVSTYIHTYVQFSLVEFSSIQSIQSIETLRTFLPFLTTT